MDMSDQEYQAYVKAKARPTRLGRNMVWAFFVGGLICVIGQGLMDLFRAIGVEENQLVGVTAITLMAAASLLTGLGVFDRIARYAGAGTLVPITGFANAMVSSAMEFRSEGVITGLAVKLFTVAGPVLVFGISASVVLGLILTAFGLA